MSEHLADAVEAVARMLPAQVPTGGEYAVARSALSAALPHIEQHLSGPRYDRLVVDLLALHVPGETDPDGLRVCVECAQVVPCLTARLAAAQA